MFPFWHVLRRSRAPPWHVALHALQVPHEAHEAVSGESGWRREGWRKEGRKEGRRSGEGRMRSREGRRDGEGRRGGEGRRDGEGRRGGRKRERGMRDRWRKEKNIRF